MLEADPLKARGRHDHAHVLAVRVVYLRETRLDIAAEVSEAEMRVQTAELG